MKAVTAVRRLQFCAGHRIHRHESKCAHLHGHNYVVFLHARAKDGFALQDRLGRVIDFGVLKNLVGSWIEQHWDHGFILHFDDPLSQHQDRPNIFEKLYLLPDNPTAENMAKYLLLDACPTLLKHEAVEVFKVVLWETENCYAEVEL